jgi:hypothetical protein
VKGFLTLAYTALRPALLAQRLKDEVDRETHNRARRRQRRTGRRTRFLPEAT